MSAAEQETKQGAAADPEFASFPRRQAAVLLLALDALLGEEAWTAEGAVVFARRVEGCLDDKPWARGKHSGDCTSEPHNCIRCLIEDLEKRAEGIWRAGW